MEIKTVVEDCKTILENYYGSRFRGIFLYGSMARGQAEKSSDIDLLVLLAEPFNYFEELRKIVEILYPVQLYSEHLISAKPASVIDFNSGKSSFYRIAKREGITA